MSKYTLPELKRILIGRNVFLFKLLDDFPKVAHIAGIDAGYFAANIAMAYRHFKFKDPAGPMTTFNQVNPHTQPIQRQVMPPGSVVLGGGSQDTFWTADEVKKFASKHGYVRTEVKHPVKFNAIKDAINQHHAPIIAFDVNAHGGPGSYGGANAQWAVILGYAIFKTGQEIVIATHSWGGYYLWMADELIASNMQLLSLPTNLAQMQLVGGAPVAPTTGNAIVSLNEVRNKMVIIRKG